MIAYPRYLTKNSILRFFIVNKKDSDSYRYIAPYIRLNKRHGSPKLISQLTFYAQINTMRITKSKHGEKLFWKLEPMYFDIMHPELMVTNDRTKTALEYEVR